MTKKVKKESITMTTLRKLINEYDENGRKEIIPELPKCKKCGEPLVSEEDYQFYLKGSWKTKSRLYALIPKIVNNKNYFRKYCENCIKEKFGKVQKFNTFNKQVIWALEIPEEEAEIEKKKYDTASIDSWIKKYGEIEGTRKYKEYCERQAYTNSFEHKKEKYGWTEEDYKKYNQSRAVTLEKMIERHGEEEGRKRWNEYVEKQKDMFGKINRNVDDEAIKINNYIKDSIMKFVGTDKNLHLVYKNIKSNYNMFYQDLNFEYFLFYEKNNNWSRVFYDITIPNISLIIELDNKNYHNFIKDKDKLKNEIAFQNDFTLIRVDDDFLVENTETVTKAIQKIIDYYEKFIENGEINNLAQLIKIHDFDDIKEIEDKFKIKD